MKVSSIDSGGEMLITFSEEILPLSFLEMNLTDIQDIHKKVLNLKYFTQIKKGPNIPILKGW